MSSKKTEIAKNQMKILLSQDIWAQKLKVKMPGTVEEKDVIIPILENRLKLDKFVRLLKNILMNENKNISKEIYFFRKNSLRLTLVMLIDN